MAGMNCPENTANTCLALLQRLKEGQKDLRERLSKIHPSQKSSIHKKRKSHSQHDYPLGFVDRLPKRRARVDQLSPDTAPTVAMQWRKGKKRTSHHNRRLSSTPNTSSSHVPDISLEEALLEEGDNRATKEEEEEEERETGSRGQKIKKEKTKKGRTKVGAERDRKFPQQAHSSLSKVANSSASIMSRDESGRKRKSRGLTVSFIPSQSPSLSSEETSRATGDHLHSEANAYSFREERERGKNLISSLNSSRYGALKKGLSKREPTTGVSRVHRWAGDDPKLGYDWIASMVDSNSRVLEKDDDYFNEMNEFRRVNHAECCQPPEALLPDAKQDNPHTSASPSSLFHSSPSTLTRHTHCTASYVLNNRLFPIRIQSPPQPAGNCPTCEGRPERGGSGGKEPQRYIRVSVPRRRLLMPYQLRPHRKRSFDPSDSMALSKHCLLGCNPVKSAASLSQQQPLNLKSALASPPPTRHVSRSLTCSHRSRDLLSSSHSVEYSLRSRSQSCMQQQNKKLYIGNKF